MATEKTLKTRVKMKHGKESEWALATSFTPLEGEIIVYDVDDNHTSPRFKVGDGTTNVNNLKFVNQDELAKITTLGDDLLAVKNGYVPNTRTINSKPLSANISLTASDVGAAASSHAHSYLPLSGGTVTGTLTVNKELYSNAAVISKRNSSPQFILQNANGAQLGSIYSGTSDGSYSDVLISVNSSNSDVVYFDFAKNGQFTAPNNIYSKGTFVSQTNSYPGLTIQNASGANLAMLYSNTTDGGYSNMVLRVYSAANKYSGFSFGSDGSFYFSGSLYSGNHSVKGNSYPTLSFVNSDTSKTFAFFQPQTSTGDYADMALVVKNSDGQSNFRFTTNGIFSAPSDIISNGGILKSSRNTNPCFAMTNQNGAWLTSLVAVTSDGSYGNAQLAVYKSATEGSTFTFSNQGSFRAPSTVYSSLFAAQSNNNPQLMLQNASGAPLGMLYMNTTTGGYSSAYLRVYSSASAYSTFNFGNDGKLSCGSLALATALPISSGGTGSTTASGALTNLGALPLTGGTLTGTLTATALYASDGDVTGVHLITKTNNYPEVYFKNATGTTLADFYVDTTSGGYADVRLKVFSDDSTANYFTFGKNGVFGIPYSFSTMMGEFKNDAWPQLFFRNAKGNALAQFVIPTDNGSYSGLTVNVFSDANSHVEYKFNSDGTFTAPAGITTTGNYISIKNNSYPQLTFSNASGADIGKFFVSTTNGSYAATKIRAYSSASSYYDFQFLGTGSFSCKTINADGIDIGADSLVQLSQNDNKGSGCISIGNINLGDWRVISVADDGRLLIDYTNPIYALGSSVIYSSSQPSSPSTGTIWLKPV